MTRQRAQILVVGSGAGGAVAAATLAEAGYDVLIAEEGPPVTDGLAPHSPTAVQRLYRNGGLSPILGKPNVAFVEGCCVGGSTEVNAGFWHRTPPHVVERWSRSHAIKNLAVDEFERLLDEVERAVGIGLGPRRVAPDPASEVLERGARRLGWHCDEVPRAIWSSDAEGETEPGARRSMSRTWLPRAVQHGARLLSECRITRLTRDGGRVTGALGTHGQHLTVFVADHVFVCGGALQTPTLLRRSGISRHIGDSLQIHLMLKLVAQFDESMHPRTAVVPVRQIRLGPDVTLGGSVCTPGFLSITLGDNWEETRDALGDWRQMALYYTLCRASAVARVRPFPLTGEAFARYTVTDADRANLTRGFLALCEAMFAAGARRLYPGLRGFKPLTSVEACRALMARPLAARDMSISSVHAFSSCPMGEVGAAPLDSFGNLRGLENLTLADASVLPSSPESNPQASIMAMALRNARNFIESRSAKRVHRSIR